MSNKTSERVRFTGITPEAFQHPLDRTATENLKRVKGFDWLCRKFVEYGIERIEYVQNIGGSVRVGPRQMPLLYEMLRESCAVLDVEEPELYISNGGVNAYTSGHDHPFIVVQTGLIDLMTDSEVLGVIAHELGHIKCGHVLYKTMARAIKPFFEMLGSATLGAGKLVGAGIEAALGVWDQRSELSSDRAALLVLQDAAPCVSMLMKLAGGTRRLPEQLSPEQFLNQARAYKEGMDDKMLDRFYRFVGSMGISHPFPVERARALDEWVNSDDYQGILAGNYARHKQLLLTGKTCPTCKQTTAPDAKFCDNCGTPIKTH
ncbi:MAG: M48 family metallopeptidase [Acidobacteria bacterium]|nr:M48 family metallopeptidase [Acidobacteriota bacterium]